MKGAAYAIRPQHQFDGKEFVRESLDGLKIVDRVVRNAKFTAALLRGAVFDRSKFMDCTFAGAQLDRASLVRAVFENCDFTGTSLVAVDAREAVFRATRVMSYGEQRTVSLTEPVTSFDGATIEQSVFASTEMPRMRVSSASNSRVSRRSCPTRFSRKTVSWRHSGWECPSAVSKASRDRPIPIRQHAPAAVRRGAMPGLRAPDRPPECTPRATLWVGSAPLERSPCGSGSL